MILVDTSVWVDHLRVGDAKLVGLLGGGEAACHPFVLGELACGNIRNRREILTLLAALPAVAKAQDAEVIEFIDQHQLMGKGLGLIDVHLLASCMLDGARLWTRARRLAGVASRLGLDGGTRPAV